MGSTTVITHPWPGVQRPRQHMNVKWGELDEDLWVVTSVGNTVSVDTGAPPHASKGLRGLTESTAFGLQPLVYVLPWKPQVTTVCIVPRP